MPANELASSPYGSSTVLTSATLRNPPWTSTGHRPGELVRTDGYW
jgi:hypothetical protein